MDPTAAIGRRRLGGEHWLAVATAFAALAGLVALRFAVRPEPSGFGTHEQLGLPPCRAIDWFGVPCPGCGVTTSVAWFAHGDLAASLATQPFGFLLAMIAAFAAPAAVAWTLARRDFARLALSLNTRRTWRVVAVLLAAAWIYKIAVVATS
jgi:hypothetical protein